MGANPLYTKLDFPYYTLALGDTTTYKDVAIHKIVSNEFVFLGNQSQIELRIRSNKCMGEKAKIQLIHNDKILSQKEIHVTREEELHKVYFNIENGGGSRVMCFDCSEKMGFIDHLKLIEL